MPREKEAYRDTLELIATAFPGKTMLTATEVAQIWGKDVRTVRKVLKDDLVKHVGISIVKLARRMS